MRLHEFKIKPEQLKLQKSELIQKIQSIGTDPESVAVIDKITQLLNDVGVGGRVQSLLARVEKIDDNDVQRAVNKIAKMVSTVDFDSTGREKLFKQWAQDNVILQTVIGKMVLFLFQYANQTCIRVLPKARCCFCTGQYSVQLCC